MIDRLQNEVDESRRRELLMKADLENVHKKDLAELKLHCKSKFRTKMLHFE
jgi:hypothetical protein